jgi:hypothetical protein
MKSQTLVLATSIVAIALVSAFLGAMVLLQPASAATNPTSTSVSPPANGPMVSWQSGNMTGAFRSGRGPPSFFGGGQFPGGMAGGFAPLQGPAANLTVGQTITLTSTNGSYQVFNDSSVNGTASATLTFTVTGKLAEGYTLSLSNGTITVGSNAYTVSSGSAQTGPSASNLQGQGATSSSGDFIVQAQARGSFAGTTAHVGLDLNVNGTDYLVNLQTTASS